MAKKEPGTQKSDIRRELDELKRNEQKQPGPPLQKPFFNRAPTAPNPQPPQNSPDSGISPNPSSKK